MARVLIVDDEPQMRRVMQAGLVASGYQVAEAESGEEACRQVHQSIYDLVLLDLNLPGIGGIETCQAIRSTSNVPIIIVSVRRSQRDKAAARAAGASDFVTKPFDMQELLDRIRAASGTM